MKNFSKNQLKDSEFLTKTQKFAIWLYNNAHVVEYWLIGVRDVFCLFIGVFFFYVLSLIGGTL